MSAASLPSSASDDLPTRLAALSAKATPGPWAVDPEHVVVAHDPQSPDRPWYVAEMVAEAGSGTISDNAAFIAAAVNAVRSGALVPATTEAARGLDVTEAAAQAVYEHYAFGAWEPGEKPAWTPRGNSDMQGMARQFARAALRTSPPETVGGGEAPNARVKVPAGQTPLGDKLGHRYLDVINEGRKARDEGTGSPYHGHSLEHCLHATGWVQRDLRIALDKAQAETALSSAPPAEETWQAASDDDLKRAYHRLVRGRPVYGGDGGTYAVEVPRQGDFIALVRSLLPPAPAGEAK